MTSELASKKIDALTRDNESLSASIVEFNSKLIINNAQIEALKDLVERTPKIEATPVNPASAA